MDDDISGSRGRQRRARLRRACVLAASAAGVTLLITACGGGPSARTASAGSPYQRALAYAQCMRTHGDLLWPDPNSQGNFVIDNPDIYSHYQSANNACKKLDPQEGLNDSLTPAQAQQKVSLGLKFAACMRGHGIADFPDPPSTGFGIVPGGFDTSSPQYQSAQQACRKFEPGGGGGS